MKSQNYYKSWAVGYTVTLSAVQKRTQQFQTSTVLFLAVTPYGLLSSTQSCG